ncbi:hypothetical protein ACFCY8_11410 [Streptomyces noursei]|uniref:hypothetical protein n=1 Tax=Streptomyces noursei TaxID=1971 RepID=UPI0035E0C1AB
MPLTVLSKTYLEVDYRELERFITEHYEMPYSVVVALETHNGSHHTVSATTTYAHYDPEAEEGSRFTRRPGLDPEEAEVIRAWRAGTRGCEPSVRALLNDLACSGHVAPGEYLISVYW